MKGRKESWIPSKEVPGNAKASTFIHPKLKKPDVCHPYTTIDGKLVGYALRYEAKHKNEKKVVLPYCYGSFNGVEGWYFKSLAQPTPLYNGEELAKFPQMKVMLLEGEKTADAAKIIFKDYICVTTFGGSSSPHKSDLSNFRHRDITVFPDNDEPGKMYLQRVLKLLKKIGVKQVSVVDAPKGAPESWDVADQLPEGWKQDQLISLVENAPKIPIGNENGENISREVAIVKDLLSTSELVVDQHDDAFIFIGDPQEYRILYAIRSDKFRKYLRCIIYEQFEETISKSELEKIQDILEAKALTSGVKANLAVRVARKESSFFYDLGDAVVEITKDGWKIKSDVKPMFRWYSMMNKQVHPKRGRSLKEVIQFTNVQSKNDALLLFVWIATSFVPDISHPPLVAFGPPGSSKSTLARFLTRLIDPCSTDDVPFYDRKEFFQAISHRYAVPIDNLSKIDPSDSDLFCKLVTGASFSKRVLYTDDDDRMVSFRRILILNGINLVVTRPDLLNRCILLELIKITQNRRITEAHLVSEFESILPEILGSCFDLVSSAMHHYQDASNFMQALPRMADFYVWGCAVTKALGYEFKDFTSAYEENITRQNIESIEASPLATVICHYLQSEARLFGTATKILRELNRIWVDAGCDATEAPRSVYSFGKQLNSVAPNLESLGIVIERRKSKDRFINIYTPKSNALSVHLSPVNSSNDKRVGMLPGASARQSAQSEQPISEDLDDCDSWDRFESSYTKLT